MSRRLARLSLTVSLALPLPAMAQGGSGVPVVIQDPRAVPVAAPYVRNTPPTDPILQQMWTEGMEKSQVARMGQILSDSIGPRLVNSDRFNMAQDWVIKQYASWGIQAKREPYGTWNSWKRGISHVDLIEPRVRSLNGMMLAWSPGTGGKPVEAEVVLLPAATSAESFAQLAPSLKGKVILTSAPNPSCRPATQWLQFGQPGAGARIDSVRQAWSRAWSSRARYAGNLNTMARDVGAVAVISTSWSGYPGIEKIFGSWHQTVPTFNLDCEDYNLVYRLAENNQHPKVRLTAEAEFLGEKPVSNVIATIRGSEKPDEYIVLSAHFDSWDGSSGTTDNGTGTLTMMEAVRILKQVYPNPKRTIVVGHWGGEEQGLNGSHAWVEDNPAIVAGVRAGFNQDNGTGRIVDLSPGPFQAAPEMFQRWLYAVPSDLSRWVKIGSVSAAATGGTDHASFQCAGAPVFGAGALGWDYSGTTWHTNRDTWDKAVMEDLQNNATLVAMLTYLADQDPSTSSMAGTALPAGAVLAGARGGVSYTCNKAARNTGASTR